MENPVTVASVRDMPDDHFKTHLETRHIPEEDFADLTAIQGGSSFRTNRPTFETYHKHLHEHYEYGHKHV